MKTNSKYYRSFVPVGALTAAVLASALLGAAKSRNGFIAHEWGTFTSVQGGDGALLDWRPLESSALPQFVYNWQHPGLNRQGGEYLAFGKAGMLTRQRMETPVIYFYSEREEAVDVTVKFPQGLITEWYPQAEQIGPCNVPVPPAVAKLDHYAHRAGAKPEFTFAALLRNHSLKDSGARWTRLEVLPARQHGDLARALPLDRSGSHYFAARDTDADYLRLPSLVATNPLPEHEKFIFYRGVGNFATPLRVTMNSSQGVTLANTGTEPLSHLVVLGLENRVGKSVYVDRLGPGEERTVQFDWTVRALPLAELSRQVGDQMAESLAREGLYRREAAAMVHTWKDSWFEEDGLRVLYVLPRAWTERTLPLTLDPAPRELVRVMVGRAEVLTPAREQKLARELTEARRGDAQAREQALAELKKLGRFAEPALRLAAKDLNAELAQSAWALLETSKH